MFSVNTNIHISEVEYGPFCDKKLVLFLLRFEWKLFSSELEVSLVCFLLVERKCSCYEDDIMKQTRGTRNVDVSRSLDNENISFSNLYTPLSSLWCSRNWSVLMNLVDKYFASYTRSSLFYTLTETVLSMCKTVSKWSFSTSS